MKSTCPGWELPVHVGDFKPDELRNGPMLLAVPLRCFALASIAIIGCVLTVLCDSSPIHAASIYWGNTGDGDWSNSANWASGTVPTASDQANVSNSGTANVTTADAACGVLILRAGHVTLSGTGQLVTQGEYIGEYGSDCSFIQNGGFHSVSHELYLTNSAGWVGTYMLSGGQLTVGRQVYVGNSGTGFFVQTGGSHTAGSLSIGKSGGTGSYDISGASQLVVTGNEYVGDSGPGTFTQSGGIHTVGSNLYIGFGSSSRGTYVLSGTGQLSAPSEYIGYQFSGIDHPGLFQQTGGVNSVTNLSIGNLGRYTIESGTLQINGSLVNSGTLDFCGGPGVLALGSNSFVDFTRTSVLNTTAASLTVANSSLLVVAPGYDPATAFLSFSNAGVLYRIGTTLAVPAGQTIRYDRGVSDFLDCQGSLTATPGAGIDLPRGVSISGAGVVKTGTGKLTVNDPLSGMTGGSLIVPVAYIGKSGAGSFTQTGGVCIVTNLMNIGYDASSSGSYTLSGTGQFTVGSGGEMIGYYGSGAFTQTGGSHNTDSLYLGRQAGSIGSYQLGGAGQLVTNQETVGYAGAGIFVQTGGTHTIGGDFYLARDPLSSGAYQLSGDGQLTVNGDHEYLGYSGTASFVQTGGTHNNKVSLYLGYNAGSSGSYELSGNGQLTTRMENVGYAGAGAFEQTGGGNNVFSLQLGRNNGVDGTYLLDSAGQLAASYEIIGNSGSGTLTQRGGSNVVGGSVILSYNSGSKGAYVLSGTGQFTVATTMDVGLAGTGVFTQTGGTAIVGTRLYLAHYTNSYGYYELGGTGQLWAGNLYVGYGGAGTFNLVTSSAGVTITNLLSFGPGGVFSAVPGSAIDFTGTSVAILSTSSTNMGGLANLNLIVEGGPGVTATVEAAGKDLGPVAAGWTDNFVLGTLTIGGTAAGRIRLVNSTTNQPGFAGTEALYVNTLVMNSGAAIDLNGLNLYYLNGGAPKRLYPGDANYDGIVDIRDYITWFSNFDSTAGIGWTGGDFTGDGLVDLNDYATWFNNFNQGSGSQGVPEPATLALVALGLPVVRRRRR